MLLGAATMSGHGSMLQMRLAVIWNKLYLARVMTLGGFPFTFIGSVMVFQSCGVIVLRPRKWSWGPHSMNAKSALMSETNVVGAGAFAADAGGAGAFELMPHHCASEWQSIMAANSLSDGRVAMSKDCRGRGSLRVRSLRY